MFLIDETNNQEGQDKKHQKEIKSLFYFGLSFFPVAFLTNFGVEVLLFGRWRWESFEVEPRQRPVKAQGVVKMVVPEAVQVRRLSFSATFATFASCSLSWFFCR